MAGQSFGYNGGIFPLTEIRDSGDYVSGGFKKTLISVGGNFRALDVLGPVTGGLLEGANRALICTDKAMYTLDSKYIFGRNPRAFKDLKCATLKDRFVFLAEGKVHLSSGESFETAKVHSLIHNYLDFFAVYQNGSLAKVTKAGLLPMEGAIGGLDSKTSVKMANELVMRLDENGLYSYKVDNSRIGFKEKLPISPCSDDELCGLSLASDQSYLVSGYWGIWHGIGLNFRRVSSIPNLSREGGRSSVSHSGLSGRFIYIGDDDADLGKLPSISMTPNSWRSERRVVWLRNHDKNQVFSWSPQKNIRSSVIIQDSSEPLPKQWVAYEMDTVLSTPIGPSVTFNSGTQTGPYKDALESSPPWWRLRMNLTDLEAILQSKPHRKIKIGIVDSGVAMNHPGLKDQMEINRNEIPDNQIDDDQNGLVDDDLGYDFIHEDGVPEDEHGHGTHVAGLISGRFADGTPMGPSADYAKLVVAKGLGASGSSNSIDLARAVAYGVSRDVDILNCSWGGGFSTQVLQDALTFAVDSGVIVMMSAGNSSLDQDRSPEFPKQLPGLTLVASSTSSNALSKSSNYGKKSVAWAVPGDEMYSTTKDGGFGMMSGTSMANGLSSGLVGLALAHSADDPKTLMSQLCSSSSKQNWNDKTFCGHLDLMNFFKINLPAH